MNALPLSGCRVLVGRSRRQSDALSAALSALGAELCAVPLIEILPPDDWTALDAALSRLETYHWILFTSANAVEAFAGRMCALGQSMNSLAARVGAVGEATAKAARQHGLTVSVVAAKADAEGLADALARQASLAGARILWPRGNLGRETLREALERSGAHVDAVVVYRNVAADADAGDLRAQILSGKIDWIALTSPSTVRNLYALLADAADSDAWRRVRLASIGPVTSRALRELGREPDVESAAPSAAALAAAIAGHELQDRGNPS